jgi:hypothetical protein
MHYETLIQGILVLAGAILAARGLRREWQGIILPMRDPRKVETFFRGFRQSILGLAAMGIATAWATDQTWLLLLSIAIGIEETIESTIDIWGLNRGRTVSLGPRPAPISKRPTFAADANRLIAAMKEPRN